LFVHTGIKQVVIKDAPDVSFVFNNTGSKLFVGWEDDKLFGILKGWDGMLMVSWHIWDGMARAEAWGQSG
jgi:hypothetical protein